MDTILSKIVGICQETAVNFMYNEIDKSFMPLAALVQMAKRKHIVDG